MVDAFCDRLSILEAWDVDALSRTDVLCGTEVIGQRWGVGARQSLGLETT